jgi:hypothetical protein
MARLRKGPEERGDADAADARGAALAAAERALADALALAQGAGLQIRSPALRRRLARALGRDGDG